MHFQAIIGESDPLHVEIDQDRGLFKVNGESLQPDIVQLNERRFHYIVNHGSYKVEISSVDKSAKKVEVRVNGRKFEIQYKDRYDDLLKSMGMESTDAGKHMNVKAPMPGMVLEILVKTGDSVEKGTPLLILEAMKMENVIKSPGDGLIGNISASKGLAVEKNELLLEFA